jgi:broad specificity phosphatase PhoE
LTSIYLVRHGQAGTRDNYDALSDIGRCQSRLLGEFLLRDGVVFRRAIAGSMRRQRETAEQVRDMYVRAGQPFPEIEIQPGWNEFDMDGVYSALAPVIAENDPEFRTAYEQLRAEMRATEGDPGASVHRRWTPCDIQVIQAWITERHPYAGESWAAFGERIRGCVLPSNGTAGDSIVFTSATPIAIRAGAALEIFDERVLRIAGVLYNSSYTVLRVRNGQVRLVSLNNTPHLIDPELRTYR